MWSVDAANLRSRPKRLSRRQTILRRVAMSQKPKIDQLALEGLLATSREMMAFEDLPGLGGRRGEGFGDGRGGPGRRRNFLFQPQSLHARRGSVFRLDGCIGGLRRTAGDADVGRWLYDHGGGCRCLRPGRGRRVRRCARPRDENSARFLRLRACLDVEDRAAHLRQILKPPLRRLLQRVRDHPFERGGSPG